MKNLVFKFSITSILMSFTLSSYAVVGVDETQMNESATACQTAIIKTENNVTVLNETGLTSQYNDLVNTYEEFKDEEIASTTLSDTYMATICANQAKSSLDVIAPEGEEEKPCTDLASGNPPSAKALSEASEDFSEDSRKKMAASYFCKHKTKAMSNLDIYRQAKAQTAGENDVEAPSEGEVSSVAEALEARTLNLLTALETTGHMNIQGVNSFCRNMFYESADSASEFSASPPSVNDIVKDLEKYTDAGDRNDYFKALVKAYKEGGGGVPAIQRGLHVKSAAQCTSSGLAFGDNLKIASPLGIAQVETYKQPLFIYKSATQFVEKLKENNPSGTKNRFCFDNARAYCAPQIHLYANCTKMSDGHAKDACKALAYKSFVFCAGNAVSNTSLWVVPTPSLAVDNSTERFQAFFTPQQASGGEQVASLSKDDYVKQVAQTLISTEGAFAPFGQIYTSFFQDNASSMDFGETANKMEIAQKKSENKFHDFYGMCTVYRWASMKNLNDEDGEVPVGERVTSVNGRYSCSLSTPWAADYRFCHYAVMWADGFPDILSIAGQTGMAIHGAVKTEQAMTTAQVEGMEGDPTAAMGIQTQQLKNRAASHWTTSGLDTLTATGAMTAYGMYPNPKKLKKGCSGNNDPEYVDSDIDCGMYYAYYNNWIEGGGQSNSDASLYPNRYIKDVMLMKAIQKFGSGIMNGLMAYEYDKQVGMLEKFREGAQEFYEDPEMNFPSDPAEQASYCQRFPTIRSCRGGSRRGGGVQGGINFAGGSQQGQNGSSFGFESNGAGEFFVDENIDAGEKKAIADLKDVIGNTTRNKFGDDFDAPGAGKGSLNSGGGGGAISGSAGGGGGGGGGAGGGSKGAGPSGQTGPRKIATKFSNGSADSFSFKSGGSDSKSKSKNPFASLVGKKNRKVASKIVDDIGPKKSQLFEKISNAYSKAKKDNRLIIINQD